MTAVLQAAHELPADPWRRRILPPLPRSTGRDRFGWGRGWVVTALVTLIGGALRFTRLGQPEGKIFDEIYYACDALNLLRSGVEMATAAGSDCQPSGGGAFIVHPPLGKWAIAVGLRLFGTNELGWRFSAAVAGTVMVLLVVRVGRRMTGSTLLGGVAGLLLSLDGLHFVQSRVAMLDIFLALFILAAFSCLVADRDALRQRLAGTELLTGAGPGLGVRPWRIGAGLCLGAALSTKWSALYYIAALVLLTFAWEVGARRTAGITHPVRTTLVRASIPLTGLLILLPVALYLLSWTGWFLTDVGWKRDWATLPPQAGEGATWLPDGLRSWLEYHKEMFVFHDGLTQPHQYQSHPVGWLLLARPVLYYYPQNIVVGQYGCQVESCASAVLAIGTPAIWWGSIIALVLLLWLWVSTRDWRAAAVLVLVLTAIVPWVRDDVDGRTMFLFYALPATPFLCLGLALTAGWALGGSAGGAPTVSMRRRAVAGAGIGLYLAVVIVNFAYLYPVLAAQTLPKADWQDRMWFTSWI